jgi:hypothetical protein
MDKIKNDLYHIKTAYHTKKMTEWDTITKYLYKKYEKLIPASYGHGFVEHDKENDNSIDIIALFRKYYEKEMKTYPRYYDIDRFYLVFIKEPHNKQLHFDVTLKPLLQRIYDNKNHNIVNLFLINELVEIIKKENEENLDHHNKEEITIKDTMKNVKSTSQHTDKDKKKKKKPISATIKRLVWNTHIGEEVGKSKCMCCKVTDITQMSFNCGHIIAEANGGETIVSNLKPICQNCNSSMGIKNMEDFMKSLK